MSTNPDQRVPADGDVPSGRSGAVRATTSAADAAELVVELERQGIDGEHVTVTTNGPADASSDPDASLDPEGITGTVARRAIVGAVAGAAVGAIAGAVLMLVAGPDDAPGGAAAAVAVGAGLLCGALGALLSVFGGLATSESWSAARAARPGARAVVEVQTGDESEHARAKDVLDP
jgi:hypothetical protein